jgi:hypothetical protein
MQAYSNPRRADDPHALPDVEYFYESPKGRTDSEHAHDRLEAGWYWWPCFPGCLPDGDPVGPFATEAECVADFTDEDAS